MAKRAICIGINDYPGTGSDLDGCVNDARDWRRLFEAKGFDVEWLLNGDATRQAIRAQIRNLTENAAEDDYLAVHYSGHGSFVPDKDGDEPDGFDECICPHDITSNGVITDDELFELFSLRPKSVKLVFFSDACYSGTIARFAPTSSIPSATRGRRQQRSLVRFLPPSTFLKGRALASLRSSTSSRRSSPPGRHAGLLMAACQDDERSREDWFNGRANGAFTYVAVRAIGKLPKDATYLDWYYKIRQSLPTQQFPQTPSLYGTNSLKQSVIFG
jgi:hypothetical protein